MGTAKKKLNPSIYVQITNGTLAEYVGTSRKETSNFEYKERFYEAYEEISGYITYIGINEAGSEAKKWHELQIRLSEEGEPDVLFKTSFPSREAAEILNRLTTHIENEQTDYFVRIRAFKNEEGRTVVLLKNRVGKLINRKFTKDEPNGLPPMVAKTKKDPKTKKDFTVYDHEEQDNFFVELCEVFQKEIREHNTNKTAPSEATETTEKPAL